MATDDVTKLGLYEVGTKVQYKYYGITPNGNKDWITTVMKFIKDEQVEEVKSFYKKFLLYDLKVSKLEKEGEENERNMVKKWGRI